MGTWDDGLFDNDSALDTLADFVDSVSLDESPAHLAAGLGIQLWLSSAAVETYPDRYRAPIEKHADWIAGMSPEVRRSLEEFAADPQASARAKGSRDASIRAVVGGYCSGPMDLVLLRSEGADAVLEQLASRCREHLDELADSPGRDLYEMAGDLSALGLLVVLTQVGVQSAPDSVRKWEAAFDRADGNTKEERGFWDRYVTRAKAGFRMLREPSHA